MTTSNTTNTVRTTKKFAFTYDHVNKKIIGTDIAFQKAGIPGSALEKELNTILYLNFSMKQHQKQQTNR